MGDRNGIRRHFNDPWGIDVKVDSASKMHLIVHSFATVVVGASGPAALLVTQGFPKRAAITIAIAILWELFLQGRWSTPTVRTWLTLGALLMVPFIMWHLIGRAPIAVTLIGGLAAHATLSQWQPTKQWPTRTTPIATLALPVEIAAGVTWFTHESIVASTVLIAAAMTIVELYARFPRHLARIDRLVTRVVSSLAEAVALSAVFVASVVTIYIPGLPGAAADRYSRKRPGDSFWRPREVTQAAVVRDAVHPFASTPPRLVRRRYATGMILAGLLVTLIATVWTGRPRPVAGYTGRPSPINVSDTGPRIDSGHSENADSANVFEVERSIRYSQLPAFSDVPFADDLKNEQDRFTNSRLLPSAVGGYDIGDFAGKFTNVNGHERATLAPDPCDCDSATVWLIGGSSAFGLGQRDEYTIASDLVRLGDAEGISMTVRNLGVPGWTLAQEADKVRSWLAIEPRPEVVVFYDGYNDVLGEMMASSLRGRHPDDPILMKTDDILAVSTSGLDITDMGSPTDLGGYIASKYLRERAAIRHELDELGIKSLFVFQPDAFASASQFDSVASIHPIASSYRSYIDELFDVVASASATTGINLRHAYDRIPDPLFGDLVHTNEVGAAIVAKPIYSSIIDTLKLRR